MAVGLLETVILSTALAHDLSKAACHCDEKKIDDKIIVLAESCHGRMEPVVHSDTDNKKKQSTEFPVMQTRKKKDGKWEASKPVVQKRNSPTSTTATNLPYFMLDLLGVTDEGPSDNDLMLSFTGTEASVDPSYRSEQTSYTSCDDDDDSRYGVEYSFDTDAKSVASRRSQRDNRRQLA